MAGKTPGLPYAKIAPLVMSRIAEGAQWCVILPYINEQMLSLGVDPSRIGFWSGLAEGLLMGSEALLGPLWGILADRFGRKPVMIGGVLVEAVMAIGYGFSTTLAGVLFMRVILGMGGGAGVVARTMLGEICGRENIVRGFALFTPALTVGVTIGSFLGGALSNPISRQVPFFSLFPPFSTYPYALPNIICGSMGIVSSGVAMVTLEETLDPGARERRRGGAGRIGAGKGLGGESGREEGGYAGLMRHRPFLLMAVLYAVFETLFPLFCFSTTSHNGLSLSTPLIGRLAGLSSLLSIAASLLVFPPVHARLGTKTMLRTCLWTYVAVAGSFPVARWVRGEGGVDEGLGTGFWVVLVLQMVLKRYADLCGVLLDASVPATLQHADQLAMANSLVFSSGGLGRAIGPIMMGAVYSYSASAPATSTFRQSLVWIGLILTCICIGLGVSMDVGLSDEDAHGGVVKEGGEGYELVRTELEEEEGSDVERERDGWRDGGKSFPAEADDRY